MDIETHKIDTSDKLNANYIDCNSNYIYITVSDLYGNECCAKSYMFIKYLPYKITGLLLWDLYLAKYGKSNKNIYRYDGLNYLPINVKCLYMNTGNLKYLDNIPILIEYIQLFINNKYKYHYYYKKLDIIEFKYISLSEFNHICNEYCNK